MEINSDRRLLCILNSAAMIRSRIDSEGMLSSCRIESFTFRSDSGESFWSAEFDVCEGSRLVVSGRETADGVVVVEGILFKDGTERVNLFSKSSPSVLSSLVKLNELPVRLKNQLNLSAGVSSASNDSGDISTFGYLMFKALFSNVEGGEDDSRYRTMFSSVRIQYGYKDRTEPVSVSLSSRLKNLDSVIVVSTEVGVFGLKQKKVVLEYGFGMNRFIRSECFLKDSHGMKVPSLMLAFDLVGNLDGMYSKQRRKKKSIGRPVSK